jgi:hypothetical protein
MDVELELELEVSAWIRALWGLWSARGRCGVRCGPAVMSVVFKRKLEHVRLE